MALKKQKENSCLVLGVRCDKIFTTRSGMNKHKFKCHGMKFSNSCNICYKTYKSIAYLKRHISFEHGYKCDKCEETFQTEDELDSHFVASHVDNNLFSDLIEHTRLTISLNKDNY